MEERILVIDPVDPSEEVDLVLGGGENEHDAEEIRGEVAADDGKDSVKYNE